MLIHNSPTRSRADYMRNLEFSRPSGVTLTALEEAYGRERLWRMEMIMTCHSDAGIYHSLWRKNRRGGNESSRTHICPTDHGIYSQHIHTNKPWKSCSNSYTCTRSLLSLWGCITTGHVNNWRMLPRNMLKSRLHQWPKGQELGIFFNSNHKCMPARLAYPNSSLRPDTLAVHTSIYGLV